jgi:hypothetical protein
MLNLGSITTPLAPYLLYIKIIMTAMIIGALAWFGWHEKGIRADLAKYKTEATLQKASTEMYAQQFNSYIQLNREIADAIKKVKVQSNTYIDSIEVSAPPNVADGGTVMLIASGVPKTLPRLPGYKNYSAGGTAASTP